MMLGCISKFDLTEPQDKVKHGPASGLNHVSCYCALEVHIYIFLNKVTIKLPQISPQTLNILVPQGKCIALAMCA